MVQSKVIFIWRPLRPSWDSFASMRTPRCRHMSSVRPQNLRPSFEAQTRKLVHPMFLRPKPPNRSRVAYSIRIPRNSTHVTVVLDRPGTKSSWAPLNSQVRCLTRSTWSLPCALALVDVLDVSHHGWSPASWSLSPSLTSVLHRSRSIHYGRQALRRV
jgi:hypothetical protein